MRQYSITITGEGTHNALECALNELVCAMQSAAINGEDITTLTVETPTLSIKITEY
jgi:hypothetical protein